MAITLVGNGAVSADKASATTTFSITGITVGGAVATASNFLLVTVATDNLTSTDGNTNDHRSVSVTKSDGGVVSGTKVREFTNGQTGAALGATVSTWLVWVPVQTGSPTFLDVSSVDAVFSGAITAKAMIALNGYCAAGNLLAATYASDLANDGADAGSMTLTPGISKERLWVRSGAVESNGTTYTASTNFTTFGNIAGATTSGGGAGGTHMGARQEWRVNTSTTETTDPTTSASDQASIMLCLEEYDTTRVAPQPMPQALTRFAPIIIPNSLALAQPPGPLELVTEVPYSSGYMNLYGDNSVADHRRVASEVTLDTDTTVTSVEMFISEVGGGLPLGDLILDVVTTLDGSSLGSYTWRTPVVVVGGLGRWLIAVFEPALSLSAGVYYFQLRTSGNNDDNGWQIMGPTGSPVSGHRSWSKDTFDVWILDRYANNQAFSIRILGHAFPAVPPGDYVDLDPMGLVGVFGV